MKSDRVIEEIKERIDIVDLIGEHIDLKRAGQNYKALCPFHSEKTPSFIVNPSRQWFHCFGCNKGGDIVTFVMDFENMTFQEALSYLAQKTGVRIDRVAGQSEGRKSLKENLFAVNKEALDFFRGNLHDARHVTGYLKERGLKNEIVEQFSLGYSTNARDALFRHLTAKRFPQEQMKASGLVSFGDKGAYDFFRDRVMFPIFDLQGRVIAFGGRVLSPQKNAPKYINSTDSGIFKKGDTCYGLSRAKQSIAQKGYSVVVEGYFDALICHQYGITNAVAPLGTALTAGHLKKLKRLAGNVLLVFDGDAAGVSATKRSLELIFAEGMAAKIVLLPAGEDPDTFMQKHGVEHFRKYLSNALSPVSFLFKVSGKNKVETARHLLRILSSCPDALLRDETLRELSDRADEQLLREELKNLIGKTSGWKRAVTRPQDRFYMKTPLGEEPIGMEEEMLLRVALSFPDKAQSIVGAIDMGCLEHSGVRRIFEKIEAIIKNMGNDHRLTDRLLETCTAEERNLVTRLLISPEIDVTRVDENIEGCLKSMALKGIERQIRLAGDAGDARLLHSLLSQKKRLCRERPEEGPSRGFTGSGRRTP